MITLVLGGARSGKSRFAERLIGGGTYIATATAGDAEMAARIAEHRGRRGIGWQTVEAPVALAEAIGAAPGPVLVDCLTLWLTNLMLGGHDIAAHTAALLGALRGEMALVSNEVGLGLVPDTPLGRRFRDAQGVLNQAVAAAAGRVVFMAAGLPLWLKGG